jgi:SAM-dependent methyltransferase
MLYYDGRHYDARLRDFDRDLPFWESCARSYGDPVLELACGTGRIALALAKAGFAVTGLEISAGMLDQARSKARALPKDVRWIPGDCRSFDLDRSFPLVIFGCNSMSHLLRRKDLEACFESVKRHLAVGGRFVVDVHNPSLEILTEESGKEYSHSQYEDPDGGGTIVVRQTHSYDRASQISTTGLHYTMPDDAEAADELRLRMFFPQELDALLKYNGFKIEHKFGDFDRSPFKPESPKQIAVCLLRQ